MFLYLFIPVTILLYPSKEAFKTIIFNINIVLIKKTFEIKKDDFHCVILHILSLA